MKTHTKLSLTFIGVSIALVTVIISCRKETTSTNTSQAGKQSVLLYLNDDPVPNLLKVLVDILYIEVKIDTGSVHHDCRSAPGYRL